MSTSRGSATSLTSGSASGRRCSVCLMKITGIKEASFIVLQIFGEQHQDRDLQISLSLLPSPFLLLRKIINKQLITGTEKDFIWAKLRTTAQKPVSQITLRSCSREAWFPAQFYVWPEQKTSHKSRIYSLKISKIKSVHTQRVSMALAPGRGSLIIEKNTSIGAPEREAFNSYL